MNLATTVAATVGERALVTRLTGTVVGGDPRALAGRPNIDYLALPVDEEFFKNGVESVKRQYSGAKNRDPWGAFT
jgi:hypothetical protein